MNKTAFNSKSTTDKRNYKDSPQPLTKRENLLEVYSLDQSYNCHDPRYHELVSRVWPVNTLFHTDYLIFAVSPEVVAIAEQLVKVSINSFCNTITLLC